MGGAVRCPEEHLLEARQALQSEEQIGPPRRRRHEPLKPAMLQLRHDRNRHCAPSQRLARSVPLLRFSLPGGGNPPRDLIVILRTRRGHQPRSISSSRSRARRVISSWPAILLTLQISSSIWRLAKNTLGIPKLSGSTAAMQQGTCWSPRRFPPAGG